MYLSWKPTIQLLQLSLFYNNKNLRIICTRNSGLGAISNRICIIISLTKIGRLNFASTHTLNFGILSTELDEYKRYFRVTLNHGENSFRSYFVETISKII